MCRALIISLFYCCTAKGQVKYKVSHFESAVLVSGNKDSLFFKSDTINLLKIGNKSFQESQETYDLSGYFKSDYISLELRKDNSSMFFFINVDSWTISNKTGTYNWNFDEKNQTLTLFYKNKLFASFTPVLEREVEIKSNYAGRYALKTKEIILRRNPP